jgi:hypothetical protein
MLSLQEPQDPALDLPGGICLPDEEEDPLFMLGYGADEFPQPPLEEASIGTHGVSLTGESLLAPGFYDYDDADVPQDVVERKLAFHLCKILAPLHYFSHNRIHLACRGGRQSLS